MNLEIITPEEELFNGEINPVKLPGTDGEFEILNNHASIISTLKKGDVKVIKSDNSTEKFSIESGVIEMKANNIIVLAN